MSAACVLVASAGVNSRFITMWKRLLVSSALLFVSRRMLDLAGVGGGALLTGGLPGCHFTHFTLNNCRKMRKISIIK